MLLDLIQQSLAVEVLEEVRAPPRPHLGQVLRRQRAQLPHGRGQGFAVFGGCGAPGAGLVDELGPGAVECADHRSAAREVGLQLAGDGQRIGRRTPQGDEQDVGEREERRHVRDRMPAQQMHPLRKPAAGNLGGQLGAGAS